MFGKILIANRGEIACRVIRTARRLGIKTVAVYSEADSGALHTTLADEELEIGPSPAGESYLSIPRIIAAAQRSGAAAIHPGYGFLSESADFASACAAAGLVFIGPPAEAIRIMGSKAASKALMEKVGVPLVPGYHGAEQGDDRLRAEAHAIGYPVLIKASAGGGGKGMRVVAKEADLQPALASARREAAAAFGDDRLLLEKYLADPRHIEVQIFADSHGEVVHLFERDCSIQRRYQKLIEEAPAPGLSEKQRQTLGQLAIKATRAVDYLGAGTIEFVAAGRNFYFIEMNTRLQVEHVATEMITGLDLVEWQIRIAAGEALPLGQNAIRRQGHAVEARLYAEDPAHGFLPAAGKLALLRLPAETPELRVETGLREGDTISPFYDALIAKLIAWGKDRTEAVQRLQAALAQTKLAGIASNRDFLLRIVSHPAFGQAAQDTGFIARHNADLLPAAAAPFEALVAATFAFLLKASSVQAPTDRHSPWRQHDFWRLVGEAGQRFRFRDALGVRELGLRYADKRFRCESEGRAVTATVERTARGDLAIDLDNDRIEAATLQSGAEIWVVLSVATWRLTYLDPLVPVHRAEGSAGKVVAPMPGKISAILVKPGMGVKRGQVLMQIEAMKMELAITAPIDGIVDRINFSIGALVVEGAELVVLRLADGQGARADLSPHRSSFFNAR
ncbi:MAG TPA: biotin carboxylase N-terminal domain-containing protein [Stellaceae bacterium]|nr:biotin carboxylase N-terminal domain-containing protein [Stellaceae bacterium]